MKIENLDIKFILTSEMDIIYARLKNAIINGSTDSYNQLRHDLKLKMECFDSHMPQEKADILPESTDSIKIKIDQPHLDSSDESPGVHNLDISGENYLPLKIIYASRAIYNYSSQGMSLSNKKDDEDFRNLLKAGKLNHLSTWYQNFVMNDNYLKFIKDEAHKIGQKESFLSTDPEFFEKLIEGYLEKTGLKSSFNLTYNSKIQNYRDLFNRLFESTHIKLDWGKDSRFKDRLQPGIQLTEFGKANSRWKMIQTNVDANQCIVISPVFLNSDTDQIVLHGFAKKSKLV